jgi:hypothetical protein
MQDELRALLEAATPSEMRVEVHGAEHADLKWIPRGKAAMLAWGQNTKPDADLLAWLWNHRYEILKLYESKEEK